MAISYPLAFPTLTGVESIRLSADNVNAVSMSPFTLKSQIQSYGGQRWRASVSLPAMPREMAEEWVGFLLKLKGKYGTFRMGDPAGKVPQGVASGSPVLSGAHAAGEDSITIKGAAINVTNWLKIGDYIQLQTGTLARMHKVLNNVTTSGTGTAIVDIWPNTRQSHVDSTVVYTSNAQGLWRLSDNSVDWDINSATFYGIQFDCEEAL